VIELKLRVQVKADPRVDCKVLATLMSLESIMLPATWLDLLISPPCGYRRTNSAPSSFPDVPANYEVKHLNYTSDATGSPPPWFESRQIYRHTRQTSTFFWESSFSSLQARRNAVV